MGISYVLSAKEILVITEILKSENIVGLDLVNDFNKTDIDQIIKEMEKKDLLIIGENSKIFISPIINLIFDCVVNPSLVVKTYNMLCYVGSEIAVMVKKDSYSKDNYIFIPTENAISTANSIWEMFGVSFEEMPFNIFTKKSNQWTAKELSIAQLISLINKFYNIS